MAVILVSGYHIYNSGQQLFGKYLHVRYKTICQKKDFFFYTISIFHFGEGSTIQPDTSKDRQLSFNRLIIQINTNNL